MSGRVKFVDADGAMVNPDEDKPPLGYEYDVVEAYDGKCGTFNLTEYEDPSTVSTCIDSFLCGSTEKSTFAKCVDSMDCHMMSSMTTQHSNNDQGVFCHQMIPHHQNAVNMAKSLLHNNDVTCPEGFVVEEGESAPWQCELKPILVDIINTQNSQIIDMRDALETLEQGEYANCDKDIDLSDFAAVGRRRQEKNRDLAESDGAFETGMDCEPCKDASIDEVCIIQAKINLFAGELGYFEFEGCTGVNPVLHLTVGKVYHFNQQDSSNWYHLVGFAYEPDGAHVPVDELEPSITPPGSISECKLTNSCPAPMYLKNGVYQGTYSNIAGILAVTEGADDFGLDAVEPLFFWPVGDWEEEGGDDGFVTALKFDVDDYKSDFFYFCHVHAGMSGRIKLKNASGEMLNMENTPALYPKSKTTYDVVSSYDQGCGTFGLEDFQTSKMQGQCPDTFFCEGTSTFTECIDSMNCAMLDGMTTEYGGQDTMELSDVVLFLRQMIPHHKNAVNMAKSLLKNGGVFCDNKEIEEGDALTAGCLLEPIARSIVNVQNSQIITMGDILESLGGEAGNCVFEDGVLGVEGTSGAAGSMLSAIIAMVGVAALFL